MTDQEINKTVARKLGWSCPLNCDSEAEGKTDSHIPDYCHSIAAAWEVVEHLRRNDWQIRIDSPCNTETWACSLMLITDVYNRINDINADTAPMAICLAFLKLA